MTTELSEDVVLQICNPQILTTEYEGGNAARGGQSGSELGRRLLLAARHGNTAQVLDLMAKGAPFTTDWLGTGPLHVAAAGAHADTCAVLLRGGVSRDCRTKVDRTPLHLAAHRGHARVAALLLAHGARADCRDMLQMTPLHWACERGHAGVAAALLAQGADPAAVSKFHKTPLALAAARGHHHVVALLRDAIAARAAAATAATATAADDVMPEIPAAEQQRALESIERLQESVKPPTKPQTAHTEPTNIEVEKPPEGAEGGAAALLRRHGITLLPQDSSSTVLNAIHAGRTVVLSDAGKLMLKESSSTTTPTPPKGVILTAAPVKSPPKAGMKIFTLNNKLVAMPKDKKVPINKIVNPQDMQMKLVTLPSDTKLAPPRLSWGGVRARRPRASAVKIVINKADYDKILAKGGSPDNGIEAGARAALCVPQEFLTNNSAQYLRSQLLSAHQIIHELNQELAALKRKLAAHEQA